MITENTIFASGLILLALILLFYLIHPRKKKRLKLAIHFINSKTHQMSLNTITLTDTLTHTGVISVQDLLGNTYSGTLANIQVQASDPTQDTVVADPTKANTIDVTDLLPNGGTSAVVTADFTSQGNGTPAAGSTATAIPDGTVFTGLKVTVTIVNAIPSTVQLQLAVNF